MSPPPLCTNTKCLWCYRIPLGIWSIFYLAIALSAPLTMGFPLLPVWDKASSLWREHFRLSGRAEQCRMPTARDASWEVYQQTCSQLQTSEVQTAGKENFPELVTTRPMFLRTMSSQTWYGFPLTIPQEQILISKYVWGDFNSMWMFLEQFCRKFLSYVEPQIYLPLKNAHR
jgi:hypothetical protein